MLTHLGAHSSWLLWGEGLEEPIFCVVNKISDAVWRAMPALCANRVNTPPYDPNQLIQIKMLKRSGDYYIDELPSPLSWLYLLFTIEMYGEVSERASTSA